MQGEDNDDHSRGRKASPVHSDTGITEAHEWTARRPLAGRQACSRGWSIAVVSSTAVVSAVTPAGRQRHQQQLAGCTPSTEDQGTAGAASCILTVRVVGE